jgi:hypothetical protein
MGHKEVSCCTFAGEGKGLVGGDVILPARQEDLRRIWSLRDVFPGPEILLFNVHQRGRSLIMHSQPNAHRLPFASRQPTPYATTQAPLPYH